jgi:hypothetical protein
VEAEDVSAAFVTSLAASPVPVTSLLASVTAPVRVLKLLTILPESCESAVGICPNAAASVLTVPLARPVIFWEFKATLAVGAASWSKRLARMMVVTLLVPTRVGARAVPARSPASWRIPLLVVEASLTVVEETVAAIHLEEALS